MNLADNRTSIVQAVEAGLLAGAVTLVWQGGKVLQVNEIGHRDVQAKLPMQRDTIFRIASMTKPVTVAAAMSLVEEGKLALSDPVTRWLPELADVRVLVDPTGPLDRTVATQRPTVAANGEAILAERALAARTLAARAVVLGFLAEGFVVDLAAGLAEAVRFAAAVVPRVLREGTADLPVVVLRLAMAKASYGIRRVGL